MLADGFSYLTSVERRLHRLEALFAELLPEVNLEEALASSSSQSTSATWQQSVSQPLSAPTSPNQSLTGSKSAGERDSTFTEAVPSEPDGFDWKEEATSVDDLADGMASLSVEPTGTGYLGIYRRAPYPACLLTRVIGQVQRLEWSSSDLCCSGLGLTNLPVRTLE